jgi:putative SOS response-associated peptidase YedK
LTCTTQDALGHIHDRSPVVLPADLRATWLDPRITDPATVRDLLAAVPSPMLATYEVSTAVNSARNDGPELIEPTP